MADDFGKVLFSPPVIIGGLILGGVILMANSGHGAAPSASTGGTDPAVLNATVAMNQSAGQNQVELANISATLGAANLSADVAKQANILQYLQGINNNNTVIATKRIDSQAGITNNIIASNTAIAVDIANNQNRLSMAYVSADVANRASSNQLAIANVQAKAQEKVSSNNAIASVANTVMKAFI